MLPKVGAISDRDIRRLQELVARFTGRSGFVTSPYRPYNRIDVRGIPRGAQVVDPSCDRIFVNP